MENKVESDKIIRDETSQENTAVLQIKKNDGDLHQKWSTEMDDTCFCEVESKWDGWDSLDVGKGKGSVKSVPRLTCVIGWMVGLFTSLEKSVIKKLLWRGMEGRRNQQFSLVGLSMSYLGDSQERFEKGN